MWKRIVFRLIVVVSYTCAICFLFVGSVSFQKSMHAVYCYNGNDYDVHITNGNLVIRTLDDFCVNRFGTFAYDAETEQEFREFQKSNWYHGDNSFWEREGFTVQQRKRICGFEFASGKYVWDLWSFEDIPNIPFTIIQIPYWALLVMFSGVPFWAVCSKVQSCRSGSRDG